MNIKTDRVQFKQRQTLIFCLLIFGVFLAFFPVAGTNSACSEQLGAQPTLSSASADEKYPWTDVRAFGAKGDGVNDDRAAFTRALGSRFQTIFLPPGVYRITSSIVIPAGKGLWGSGDHSTIIQYIEDEGTAVKLNNSGFLSGFKVESSAKNQTGILVAGVHPVVRNIELHGFQNIGLRVGDAGVVGAYFAEIDNIFVYNKTNQGNIGILVDGQRIPNSNANTFRNLFVKGKFTTLVNLKGNDNFWHAGGIE